MTTPPSLGKRVDTLEIATRLLTYVEDHFDAAGVDLPSRRYLLAGNPTQTAWDCEQVTVGLAGVNLGAVPDQLNASPRVGVQASVVAVRHAALIVEIVRCTPSAGTDRRTGRAVLPDPADIDIAGRAFMVDAGLLSQALVAFAAHLAPEMSDLSGRVQAGYISPQGPEGGYHSVTGEFYLTAGNLV